MSSSALSRGISNKRLAVGHALLSVSFLALFVVLNRPEVIVLTSLGTTVWYPATGLALALMLAIGPWYAPLPILLNPYGGTNC